MYQCGELCAEKKNLLDSKPQIDKSEPLRGAPDRTGKTQFYRFNQELTRKIEEYRKAGKDPHGLFDPAKPDYVGKPETIAPYQLRLQFPANDPPPNIVKRIRTREKLETIEEYLKRTKQVP